MGGNLQKQPTTDKHEEDDDGLFSYGVSSMQGWRVSMEDTHVHLPCFDTERGIGLFAVFDGHGGEAVAKVVQRKFPILLKENELYKRGKYGEALKNVFLEIDCYLDSVDGRNEVFESQPPSRLEILCEALPQDIKDKLRRGEQITEQDFERSDICDEIKEMVLAESEEEEEEDETYIPPKRKRSDPPAKKMKKQDVHASGCCEGAMTTEAMDTPVNPKKQKVDVEQNEKPGAEAPDQTHEANAKVADSSDDTREAIQPTENSPETAAQSEEDSDGECDLAMLDMVSNIMEFEDEMEKTALEMPRPKRSPDLMGCTANVVLLQHKPTSVRMWIANCGDSRSVLCRGGKAYALSTDHTPRLRSEFQRIQAAGGIVNKFGRVDGDLNLSRSLGDLHYKRGAGGPERQKISGVPQIKHVHLKSEDEFVVIGCDGLWERVVNQSLINFVRSGIAKGIKPLSQIASSSLDLLLAADPVKTRGLGCDNMSMIILRPTVGTCLENRNEAEGSQAHLKESRKNRKSGKVASTKHKKIRKKTKKR